MTYKQRNSIILGVQTLIVAVGGLIVLLRYYPAQFTAIKQEIARCEQTINQIPQREAYLAELNTQLDINAKQLAGWNKTIESDVTMADVLVYLNSIQNRFGEFKFNLSFIKEVETAEFGYKDFSLSGEGDWESIFALIWILENGQKLFTIEKIEVRGVETMEDDEDPPYYTRFKMIVPFKLQVKAIYSSAAIPADFPVNPASEILIQLPAGRNIFYPAIIRSLPPNDAGLLEVERAELKALLPGKAIIADHLGNLQSLVEGDPVFLGYLLKINQPASMVEFLLNKGGIVEKFSLKLMLGIEKEGKPG